MKRVYKFVTSKGVASIWLNLANGRFHVFFGEEDLGSYINPIQAADDIAGGHTSSPSSGIDTSTLNIPYDLAEWDRLP